MGPLMYTHTIVHLETQGAVGHQQHSVVPNRQSALCCGIVGKNRKADYCNFDITRVTHVSIAIRLHFIVQVIMYLAPCFQTTFTVSVSEPRNLLRHYFLLNSTWSTN